MARALLALLLALLSGELALGFTNVYPKLKSYPLPQDADVGKPLFLTPLIESGKIDEARKLAFVQHKEMNDVGSYSGYFTVNKEYNSNMFFWFFPAQINPQGSANLLYLQGGPGDTSLFGLFLENGPFSVTKNNSLKLRKYSWNVNHNVLYIDNPIGTGYSFGDDAGYARNESAVAENLYQAVYQFFELFPEIRKNEFYVSGESYAGKYVPALSRAIRDKNEAAKLRINLQGMIIGSGWVHPPSQILFADYLYQIGLVDPSGRAELEALQAKAQALMAQEKYMAANLLLAEGTLRFKQLTGFDTFFNYLQGVSAQSPLNASLELKSELFAQWVQRPDVRRAIHVGDATFHTDMAKVARFLANDIAQSMGHVVAELLEQYRLLVYNGQLDIVCAYPMTEHYLRALNWTGAAEYGRAPRKQWWVADELAGYTKTAGRLTEALVRNAGHAAPIDQPRWVWDLVTRFTQRKSF